jgi:uncharacterized protein
MRRGLSFLNICGEHNLAIDPDNTFWAILPTEKNPDLFLPREVVSLYQRMQNKLDIKMQRFRFNTELNAIYIDPTDRCNANCSYCYIPTKIRKNGRQMTAPQLEYILQKIATYFIRRKQTKKKSVIVFHASEPLLVKDIVFKTISKFKDTFHFGLQTNALLLEREDVDFLRDNKVSVGISLDSHKVRVNDKLRPSVKSRGNFKKAVEAINWFKGYVGLNVITTITKFNVGQLPELIKFLHKKLVSCVLLNPVRLTQKSARSIQPSEDILIKYFIKAVDTAIKLSQKSKRKIIIGNFANIILGIVAPIARRLMCDISPCGGGRTFLTITSSGKIIPCGEFIGLEGFSGGNIFKKGISEAMCSKAFRQIRARFVEKIPECAICTFRNICGAPCPAELHSLGNMYQPSIFCKFYKEIIKYAFKLIAERKEKYLLRQESLKNLEYEYKLKRGVGI